MTAKHTISERVLSGEAYERQNSKASQTSSTGSGYVSPATAIRAPTYETPDYVPIVGSEVLTCIDGRSMFPIPHDRTQNHLVRRRPACVGAYYGFAESPYPS